MPLSGDALAGLRAAVEYNPFAAWQLLGILRETPALVRYKPEDRYGPLAMMLFGAHRRWIAPGVSIPVQPPPFPEEQLTVCAVFNEEWLRRAFTKRELADTLARVLADIAPRQPGQRPAGGSAVLYNRGGG